MLVRPIAEQQILSNLATNPEVLQQRLVVEDVKSDPRKRSLEVTFRFSDAPTALTRLVVRRSAAVVASATFAASPETSLVTVRAIVNVPGKYSAGEPRLVLVSGAPKEITGIDLGRASDEQLDAILSDEWWGPEIAP
jgi:multidrug efflux pump subunit AcrA (membrane-fusion protein)